MAKIKTIEIGGLRGIKDPLKLDLNKKSLMVYGDNGTGKSSVTDSMEWFYFDKIEHLSNEEIGRKQGRDALRNIFISREEDGYIDIKYSDNSLDATKSINSALNTSISNNSSKFEDFMSISQAENLILRYRDLVKFIIASKTEKLKELQKIIGFSTVANMRDLLRKNATRIERFIRATGYDSQKSSKQQVVLNNLGQNAYTNEQFFQGVNELAKPLNLKKKISTFEDIKSTLESLETNEDKETIQLINFYTRVGENLLDVQGNINDINEAYKVYEINFSKLNQDKEKINKLLLLELLQEGESVLRNDVIKDDNCPLCLQYKRKIDLIRELGERIEELEDIKQEKKQLNEQGEELKQLLQSNINTIDNLLKEKLFDTDEQAELKTAIESIETSLNSILDEGKKELGYMIKKHNEILLDDIVSSRLIKKSQEKAKALLDEQQANVKLQIHTKLLLASTAYNEYQNIENEQSVLTVQQTTFESLYADFIKRQESALNAFLELFSNDINDYYSTMNPSEKIEDIKLVPIKDRNNDMVGVTIEYKFFDVTKTPPIAYLSESHINCLGLSFFLASVKAFNEKNEFFVLDDIISSFDRSHRYRFAKLLTSKFKDYQVILLTHEKELFDLVSSDVKSKGWLLYSFKWTKDCGTGIKNGLESLKEKIEKKITDKNVDGLGNDIRIYTEDILKHIACEIEAKVAYRTNNLNEKRMAPELLDSIQSKLSKSSSELKSLAEIPRIKGMPMFLGNTASHDSDFQITPDDLSAMWEDIKKLISYFFCAECNKLISINFIDNVNKKIRCKCGKLVYDWKS